MKFLTTHSTNRRTGYHVCLFIKTHNSSWLPSYIHACTNETHSIGNLQDLRNPYFGSNNYRQHKLAKVGIKSCRFAIECVSFVHAWM